LTGLPEPESKKDLVRRLPDGQIDEEYGGMCYEFRDVLPTFEQAGRSLLGRRCGSTRPRVRPRIHARPGWRAASGNDPRRRSVRWEDLSLDDGSMDVYRKKQQWDGASLPEPVISPPRSYRKLMDT
jgi:hypothetical protein